MLKLAASLFVALGGFTIMVLEIIGVRLFDIPFGGSFYVWTSQIGMILTALTLGYAVGGALADRFKRARFLALPLAVAGIFTYLIPTFGPPLLEKLVMRHPLDQDIPALWKKLDPALGSLLVFFLPCFVLAILSPYTIRLATARVERVGTIAGLVYAASTAGSIAGVFISGYILIDYYSLSEIFHRAGILILFLAVWSVVMDRWLVKSHELKT